MAAARLLVALCVAAFVVDGARAQKTYKVCAKEGNSQECQALERGSSNVVCTQVTDSVDCLLKMTDGRADFSIMTPEELILSTVVNPDKFHVVASVRHIDRRYQKFQFQSVAVVPKDYSGGLNGLSGGRLCHPGYGKAKEQLWSDRVLKYFEKRTAYGSQKCDPNSKSSAEDDARDLAKFFSEACRPGPWISDPVEDKKLKEKFPTLCSLCTSNRSPDCDGYRYFEPYASAGTGVNSHLSAIQCLTSGKGTVAYVAYGHVLDFFKNNPSEMSGYSLLCENGTQISLNGDTPPAEAPCAWVHQPWGVILARKDVSEDILKEIKTWMPSGRGNGQGGQAWIESLEAILFRDETDVLEYGEVMNPQDYITEGRPMPTPDKTCHRALRWCTISDQEQTKCLWVKSASLTLGLQPEITCLRGESQFDCISMIKQERADFVSTDSNLGFIGRKHYNISAVLYHETLRAKTSKVFAIIKDAHKDTITRFENLRDKNACFPEYGGIGWVAFMRTAHERRVISSQECDYASEVANFFHAACAPGATDPGHFPTKGVDPSKLCLGCHGFSPRGANEQGVVSQTKANLERECPANPTNEYYGNRGALRCLSEPMSHVAFLEGQNLEEHAAYLSLDPKKYRMLCRNGSLAQYPGFKVDDGCALAVTIDSEVVARRSGRNNMNLELYLQDMDGIFGYNTRSIMINFQVFSPFNDTKNLLFKDSTIGLAKRDSENEFVKNYIELFKHTESCTTGGAFNAIVPSAFLLALASLMHLMKVSDL